MPTSGSERPIPVLGNAHCGGRGGRSSWRLRPGLVGLWGHGPDSRAGAAPRVLQAGAPGTPWAAPRPARPSWAAAGPLRALQTHRGAQCQEGGTPTPQPVGDLRDPRPCGPAGVATPPEPRFSPSVKWASGLGSSEREGPAADRALTDSCPGWESRCRLCLQPAKAAAPLKQRNSSPPHSPRAPRALPGPSLLNCTPSLASPADGAPRPSQPRAPTWAHPAQDQALEGGGAGSSQGLCGAALVEGRVPDSSHVQCKGPGAACGEQRPNSRPTGKRGTDRGWEGPHLLPGAPLGTPAPPSKGLGSLPSTHAPGSTGDGPSSGPLHTRGSPGWSCWLLPGPGPVYPPTQKS